MSNTDDPWMPQDSGTEPDPWPTRPRTSLPDSARNPQPESSAEDETRVLPSVGGTNPSTPETEAAPDPLGVGVWEVPSPAEPEVQPEPVAPEPVAPEVPANPWASSEPSSAVSEQPAASPWAPPGPPAEPAAGIDPAARYLPPPSPAYGQDPAGHQPYGQDPGYGPSAAEAAPYAVHGQPTPGDPAPHTPDPVGYATYQQPASTPAPYPAYGQQPGYGSDPAVPAPLAADPQGAHPQGSYPGPAGYPQAAQPGMPQAESYAQQPGAAPGNPQGGPPQPGGYPQGSYPPQGHPQTGQPYAPQPKKDPGALGALFDFSFSGFVTPKIARVVYLGSFVVFGGAWVAAVLSSFAGPLIGGLESVGTLLFGWLPALLAIMLVRVGLDAVLAQVRLVERADEAAERAAEADRRAEAERAEKDARAAELDAEETSPADAD
ncbi:MAG: DUF4282 domain-containing protein [Propioniciclava sp.]